MTEEDEFGMNKPGAFESDPMELQTETAVKDHPDFAFLSKDAVRELAARGADDAQAATWLQQLPIERDATQWTFLEVQIRPDRAWLIIQELAATICIGHGMMLAEQTPTSVLFRKKVGQDSMAHGMMDVATYQNLLVTIGVLPSKLRVAHIGYLVSNEQKLVGGVTTSYFSSVSGDRMKALNRSMDALLAALQSTLTSQYLTASYLYMTTPENTAEPGRDGDEIQLDTGYISDVRKMFLREMKANMRELCIPLEEYAHQQEYACALLLGLLDPLLKKHGIDLSSSGEKEASDDVDVVKTNGETSPTVTCHVDAGTASGDAATTKKSDAAQNELADQAMSNGKLYGEAITDLVHELWTKYKRECETKVKQKIEEKQKQVTARVQAVHKLRVKALESIIEHPNAAVTTLKPSTQGTREDVLLYDGSCMINSAPVRLHITYRSIIYRSMVPLFARTTIIPFADVVEVAQSTTLGIRVVNLSLNGNHTKGLTVAMGLEVDLLHQLLLEILDMQKRDRRSASRRSSASTSSHTNMSQFDAPDLETLIGAHDEEEKEDDDDADDAGDEEQDVTLRRLIEADEQQAK